MIRLLALSDLHGNLDAAQALAAQAFAAGHLVAGAPPVDAVIIAGDLGSAQAAAIVACLSACGPVLYVLGNWDKTVPYAPPLAPGAHHLHLAPYRIGDHAVIGFSGCRAHWGRNPIAAASRAEGLPDSVILPANRQAMLDVVHADGLDPARLIVVTHERTPGLPAALPGLALHLFGHLHGFSDRTQRGLRCVNVSALDLSSSRRHGGTPGYVLIEWSASGIAIAQGYLKTRRQDKPRPGALPLDPTKA